MAQGVENYSDKIILNDTAHFMGTNSNAEYKRFTIDIDKSEYHIGLNSLTVVSAKNTDFDDFRFTNVEITFLDMVDNSEEITLDDLINNLIVDTDTTVKEVTVTNFWQSNSSGIYKASCKENELIMDGQFSIKNSGNTKIYIDKVALAVHSSSGEYIFDMRIDNVYRWLDVGDSVTISKGSAWFTALGNFQMIAKAYYDGAWHNLSIKNFTIIENPSCNDNQNDGYFPSSHTTVTDTNDYQNNNDYDFDEDYDGDDDGYQTENFAPVKL
jgi:hypothetical protein